MIRILAFLTALLASTATLAQAPGAMQCFDPNGGAGAQWVPCQPSNAAAIGNLVSGTGSATTNSPATIIAAQGAKVRIYVTGVQCARTDAGTSAMYVTLNDGASSVIVLPDSGGGGGNNQVYQSPLIVALNTALTFTESTNTSTVYCNAQGYQGK